MPILQGTSGSGDAAWAANDAVTVGAVENATGAINVGADAVAQPVNIGTGAAARVISIGDALSANTTIEGGVGGVTLIADTSIANQGRTTTTDGVAAGTVKVVGGRSFASLTDSATLTSLAAPTPADTTFAIPADTFKSGTLVKIIAVCRSIAVNGADTIQYSLRWNDGGGADVLVASTAINVGANNRVRLEGTAIARAAPGAAVGMSAYFSSSDLSVAAVTSGPAAGAVLTLATNAAVTIDVLVTHSANNAGNQSVVESLYVEVV
jgi:hypothetical protein